MNEAILKGDSMSGYINRFVCSMVPYQHTTWPTIPNIVDAAGLGFSVAVGT